MLYHLYQRTINHNGKKVKAWYYWFYDVNKKQVRKSCGQAGKPCLVKREAQAFIETLPDEIINTNTVTFNQFAKDFYQPNSQFVIKQHNRGIDYKANTLQDKQFYLNKFLQKFGDFNVNKLTTGDIDNWLLSLDLCASVRNQIQCNIMEVYKELYSYHLVNNLPLLQRYKRNDTKEKGILTMNEIKMLFPDDVNSIMKTWTLFGGDETESYVFATMIYTIISTGMRSCEIRALQWNQFVQKDVILINAMVDGLNKRVNTLKKGNKENKKWRVAILPEKTCKMIETMKLMYDKPTEYVFERHGERFDTAFLLDHFKLVLKKNGIDHRERNITIHSLRFTYNSLMRPEISGDNLRLMLGHVSASMTDYYDKSEALQHVPELLKNKDIINSVWG